MTKVDSSSTRYWHAKISASILSEQLGRQIALVASTRERPPSIAYMIYPAPPIPSSRRQLPSNWPTIWMDDEQGASVSCTKIISLGSMGAVAVILHSASGDSCGDGVIVAFGWRPIACNFGGVISLSQGCPRGSIAMVSPGLMAVVAVQMRSGSAADCKFTASLAVSCMWQGWCGSLLPTRGGRKRLCCAGK